MGYVKLFFKRSDHDIVGLITFFVALLGISILSEYLKIIGVNWYWVFTYNIIFLILMRVFEILLGTLLSQWNQKVHFGFYVMAALAVVLLVTYVF